MYRITCIVIFVVFFLNISAQEKTILYSHYGFNGLAINPAYSGSHEMLSIGLSHRSQWIGFEGAPSYNIVNLHTPLRNTKTGLGILVMNESIGLRKYTGIYLNYAHRIKLGQGKLALGLKAGMAAGSVDQIDLAGDDYIFNENSIITYCPILVWVYIIIRKAITQDYRCRYYWVIKQTMPVKWYLTMISANMHIT